MISRIRYREHPLSLKQRGQTLSEMIESIGQQKARSADLVNSTIFDGPHQSRLKRFSTKLERLE